MSRRQGAEGFQSRKKARKHEKLNRSKDTRNERENVIIACEDSVSAPLYFRSIFKDLKENHAIAASSLIIAEHNHTDPLGVLQDLRNHPDYQSFDHQWIVIDRDQERTNSGGHPISNFNQAISDAKREGIQIAYSNPCFEIWYLLHFEYRNTAIDRDELCEKLETAIGYQKNKLPQLSPDRQKTAIRNAKTLIESWQLQSSKNTVLPATDNPSTTVYELVDLLNRFKKPI